MKKPVLFFLAASLLFARALPAAAQVKPDGDRAFAHTAFLASDDFQGRKSGTPEYRKAAEYVAAKMKEYGLQPGGDNGTWFQEVEFKNWSDVGQPLRLEVLAPKRLAYFPGRGRDFSAVSNTGSGTVKGGLVFAGYGMVSEKDAWDDYASLDVKGKIVLLMPGTPPFASDDARKEWTLDRKVEFAAEKGAVGIIEMDVAPAEPQQAGPRQRPGFLRAGSCPAGFVVLRAGRGFVDDVFYMTDKSWKDLVSKTLRLEKSHTVDLGATAEMEAHYVSEDRTAPSVIGILPGTDPKLMDECLVIGGHLDHLGISPEGYVYNGADDNAASVGVILEIARVLNANRFRPARSIVFAAWAGEELGLRGSRHYTEHPVFPLDKTALYMNMDMVGTGDSDLLVGGMWLFSDLYDIIERGLSGEMKAKLRTRLNYRGSDHSSFWGKNVPAISLRTGEVLTRGLDDEHPEYHYPGDRPEIIDPELLRLACQYHLDILTNLAVTPENLLDPIHRTMFVHKDSFVADLHCDTIGRFVAGQDLAKDNPKGHIDIPKLKRGAVDLQVFACYAPPPRNEMEKSRSAKGVFEQIDAVKRLVDANPDDLALILTSGEIRGLATEGKTGILIGIEGGYAIENSLALLRTFYESGVRLMTLTHWYGTDWADGSGDEKPRFGGLTELGESVVREMNRLGMIIDVSHVHDETFWDVVKLSKAPVVASHSCCRALSPHHRNLSDEMLAALAKNGGVIGINYYPPFLNSEIEKRETALFETVAKKLGLPADWTAMASAPPEKRARFQKEYEASRAELAKTLPRVDVKTVVDHIDHVVKVTGNANHVGLGSDFDGISSTPVGLENVGLLPNITKELAARGYKPEDIRRILGGNFQRVFSAVERMKER
jgi:membrane dipeptidase